MEKSSDAFRTISEVAEDLDLPQHVLRFWETRFSHIRPLKRAGGRRYYRPSDVVLLKSIRALLYDQGYTIKGVQRLLKEQGPRALATSVATASTNVSVDPHQADYTHSPVETDAPAEMEAPAGQSHLAEGDQDTLLEMLALIEECTRILETARRT